MQAKAKRAAPTKPCPGCGAIVHARIGKCKKCGHVFETAAPKPRIRSGSDDLTDATVTFVKAAGSLEQAQAALRRLDRIMSLAAVHYIPMGADCV